MKSDRKILTNSAATPDQEDKHIHPDDSVEVFITRCRENAILPFYAKPGDAGMDITAACEVILAPGETTLVPTGIKVAIPEGFEIQVRPRSGLSLNTPLRIPNSPGTIDAGYRDEICIILSNTSRDCKAGSDGSCGEADHASEVPLIPTYGISTKGNKPGIYRILAGDRIAQIVLQKVPRIAWIEKESVNNIGFNRQGGFGSTGEKL